MTEISELEAAIASLGLTYSTEFVPQSKSRNAGEKSPSLNWRVTIAKDHYILTTDYMQGIGHLPQLPANVRNLRMAQEYEQNAAESGNLGVYRAGRIMTTREQVREPLLRDVLYSLVMDASVIDYATFEDWASEYAYDTDSRSGERTYCVCLEHALKLRAMIGEAGLTKLREVFQGY